MAGDVKVGDTVKVTFEAEVIRANSGELCLASDVLYTVWVDRSKVEVEKVEPEYEEKVEPEYEVFGPGDVVRTRNGYATRTLTTDGYVRHDNHHFYRFDVDAIWRRDAFTSENFERVT